MPKVVAASQGSGARATRSRRVSTTLAELNVIPLVVVMLVLHIIYMVAAPMLQRGVEVTLPAATQSREISSERIFVDVPLSYKKDGRVHLGKESVPLAILAERVRQMLVNRADKKVFVRSDNRLDVQTLIDVLDALKAGGVDDAGIVTDSDRRRR